MAPPPDPRSPVLVGTGTITQHLDGAAAADGLEAVDLMAAATEQARHDTGAAAGHAGRDGLLAAATSIIVPQGMWAYPDPGRLLAERFGLAARTTLAEIGVVQQDVIAEALRQIASGEHDVVLVVGGEAKHRDLQARIAGAPDGAPETAQPEGTRPDRTRAAPSLGVDDIEILRHAVDPSTSYALIDTAIGHAAGLDPVAHTTRVGDLWHRFALVAEGNPYAWDRTAPSASAIVDPAAPGNRTIATPYTKQLCSQWNVDQAVALLFASAEAADRFGVPLDHRIHPHASAVANHALPVVARAELHRCPGARVAATRALDLARTGMGDVSFVDLYSCFPAAVQLFAGAVGLDPFTTRRDLTVTGGMTFFGGPLNTYGFHGLAALVPLLREAPGEVGLSSSVSGFLVKQGFGLWSAAPPVDGFLHHDVSAEADTATRALPVDAAYVGPGTIVTSTVVHAKGTPARVVSVLDTPHGTRTIATSTEPALLEAFLADPGIGTAVAVDADGHLAV